MINLSTNRRVSLIVVFQDQAIFLQKYSFIEYSYAVCRWNLCQDTLCLGIFPNYYVNHAYLIKRLLEFCDYHQRLLIIFSPKLNLRNTCRKMRETFKNTYSIKRKSKYLYSERWRTTPKAVSSRHQKSKPSKA